ncbi:WD repeat-containing protein 60 [Trichinella sp. T9]|nr:WD repeat-containing protein 60 [Trichinella sp. T9]
MYRSRSAAKAEPRKSATVNEKNNPNLLNQIKQKHHRLHEVEKTIQIKTAQNDSTSFNSYNRKKSKSNVSCIDHKLHSVLCLKCRFRWKIIQMQKCHPTSEKSIPSTLYEIPFSCLEDDKSKYAEMNKIPSEINEDKRRNKEQKFHQNILTSWEKNEQVTKSKSHESSKKLNKTNEIAIEKQMENEEKLVIKGKNNLQLTNFQPPVEDEEENFEDDFEEYEEDFEEYKSDTDEEKQNGCGIVEQNEDTFASSSAAQSAKTTETDSSRVNGVIDSGKRPSMEKVITIPNLPDPVGIDFSRASLGENHWEVYQELLNRFEDLKPLIELEAATYNMIDIPPLSDYDLFLRRAGRSGILQKATQTKDDNVDREIEVIQSVVKDKQIQHPAENNFTCTEYELQYIENIIMHYAHFLNGCETDDNNFMEDEDFSELIKRNDFVTNAGTALLRIIELNNNQNPLLLQSADDGFSTGKASFNLGLVSQECHVTAACFDKNESFNRFVISCLIKKSPLKQLQDCGISAVWKCTCFTKPEKLLFSNCEASCCCFFTGPSTSIVFAGLKDGSVVAWDLFESDYWHDTIPWKEGEVEMKKPTYDTAHYCCKQVIESGTVLSLTIIGGFENSKEDLEEFSFQLASLHHCVGVYLWSVILRRGRKITSGIGSCMDLGLGPGGCVILTPARRICTTPALCLLFTSDHFGRFTLAGSDGHLIDVPLFADTTKITNYRLTYEKCEILCLDLSPFDSNIFLAGSAFGTIHIYSRRSRQSLVSIQATDENGRRPATFVQWSPTNPLIFYSIHAHSSLLIWKKLNDQQRWNSVSINLRDRVCTFSITARVVQVEEKIPKKNEVYALIGFASGTSELHRIEEESPPHASGENVENSLESYYCEKGEYSLTFA